MKNDIKSIKTESTKTWFEKKWHEVKIALKNALNDLGRTLKGEQLWVEIDVSSGIRPEETMRRFTYLRAHGVRCRLLNLGSVGIRGIHAGSVILRVHKDDFTLAYTLLREMPH